jgi:hypothetical protein
MEDMNEDFIEILSEHWPRASKAKLSTVADELVRVSGGLTGIEDVHARIPVKTIEFGNAFVQVDANNDVVSVKFKGLTAPEPIF